MTPQEQSRIFESFTQADDSTTRRYGGTGLGTTISRQLVELMGGQLHLASEPGEGSRFWFDLTFEKQLSADQDISKFNLGDNRVLLVSGDTDLRKKLREHMASWGVDTTVAKNTAQAFALLMDNIHAERPYHAALVDQSTLDIDAKQFSSALRGEASIGGNLPLILIESPADSSDLIQMFKAGYASTLTKPVDKTLLFNALHATQTDITEDEGTVSLARRYSEQQALERSLRVLVAEDNAVNQKVLTKILERAGHSVDPVANGEEALDALEHSPYDVVIMDMQMPVMGGIEAAKIYNYMHRGSDRAPIIMLTANATREAREQCDAANVDAYLTKPVEARRLVDTISKLVSEAREGEVPTDPTEQPGPQTSRQADAILNTSALHDLEQIGGGRAFLNDLFEIFAADAESLLERMEAAAYTGDRHQLRELTHALKGSAGNVGAALLHDACANYLALNQPATQTFDQAFVHDIRATYEQVREAQQKYLSRDSSAAL